MNQINKLKTNENKMQTKKQQNQQQKIIKTAAVNKYIYITYIHTYICIFTSYIEPNFFIQLLLLIITNDHFKIQ